MASRRHHVRIIVATAESTIVLEKRLDHLHCAGWRWRSRQAGSGQSLSKAHLGVVSAMGNGLLTSLGFSPMRLDDAPQRWSENTISDSKNFCARKRNVPGRHTKPPGRLQSKASTILCWGCGCGCSPPSAEAVHLDLKAKTQPSIRGLISPAVIHACPFPPGFLHLGATSSTFSGSNLRLLATYNPLGSRPCSDSHPSHYTPLQSVFFILHFCLSDLSDLSCLGIDPHVSHLTFLFRHSVLLYTTALHFYYIRHQPYPHITDTSYKQFAYS
jgi:hypothetical protein